MNLNIATSSINNVRIAPSSSLVEYLEFDKERRELKVKYLRGRHKGKVRKYKNISSKGFFKILESESVGKAVIKLVKNKQGVYQSRSIKDLFLGVFL